MGAGVVAGAPASGADGAGGAACSRRRSRSCSRSCRRRIARDAFDGDLDVAGGCAPGDSAAAAGAGSGGSTGAGSTGASTPARGPASLAAPCPASPAGFLRRLHRRSLRDGRFLRRRSLRETRRRRSRRPQSQRPPGHRAGRRHDQGGHNGPPARAAPADVVDHIERVAAVAVEGQRAIGQRQRAHAIPRIQRGPRLRHRRRHDRGQKARLARVRIGEEVAQKIIRLAAGARRDRAQRSLRLARAGEALAAVDPHQPLDGAGQIAAHARVAAQGRHHLAGDDLRHGARGAARHRQRPGGHLVQGRAQRVQIGARIQLGAGRLLRRHERRRAEQRAGPRDDGRVVVRHAGDAEVAQHQSAALGHQHVARLDVAVDHAGPVRVGQRAAQRHPARGHDLGRAAARRARPPAR